MKNILTKCVVLLVLLYPNFACKKLVTVPPPTNLLTADVVFENDASAGATMTGLYVAMQQTNLYFATSALTVYPGMSADELQPSNAGNALEFYKNTISPSNGIISGNIWTVAYNYIYQANAIIEGVSKSNNVSPSVKKQLRGEALFIRAFCHFYMVNLFGDIPLVTSTAVANNASQPRIATSTVLSQIENDLSEADTLLGGTLVRGRPTKWASMTLLARTLLYEKNYSAAAAIASTIITQSGCSLETDLNKVFVAQSKETIFQFVPLPSTINTFEGSLFIPGAGEIPGFTLSPFLINAFETGDNRKTTWTGNTTINATTYYYPYKYKVKSGSNLSEYYSVMRLAEVYLIRAEAYTQLNNLSAAQADLNIIRNRAGLANTTAATNSTLLSAILKERQIELFAEWGHRWFDLKRMGQTDNILSVEKPGWKSTAAMYPIPSSQIALNLLLQQNAGY